MISPVPAGQICLAPEYLLCREEQLPALEASLVRAMQEAFGKDPKNSPDLARMVSCENVDRIASSVSKTKGRILCGGEFDRATRYVAPTIISCCPLSDPIMQVSPFRL